MSSVREAVLELQELIDGQALTSEQIAEKIDRGLIATRSAISSLAKKGGLLKDQSGGHTALYSLPQPDTTITPRDLLTGRHWKPTTDHGSQMTSIGASWPVLNRPGYCMSWPAKGVH